MRSVTKGEALPVSSINEAFNWILRSIMFVIDKLSYFP